MNAYQAIYDGVSRRVNASNHIVARSLAERWFFNREGTTFDKSYLVLVDIDASGYGAYTGHCRGCAPEEMCSRSGSCGWYDQRDCFSAHYNIEEDQRINEMLREQGVVFPTAVEQLAARYMIEHPVVVLDPTREEREARYGKTKDFGPSWQEQVVAALQRGDDQWLADYGYDERGFKMDEEPHVTDAVTKKAAAEHFLNSPTSQLLRSMHGANETTWARIQQEELDKVHAIWSRRSGDPK